MIDGTGKSKILLTLATMQHDMTDFGNTIQPHSAAHTSSCFIQEKFFGLIITLSNSWEMF